MASILAIEACFENFSIAIKYQSDVHSINISEKHKQAELLVPKIKELLEQNKISLNEITHITTTNGPGSFTAIRTALTIVNSLLITNKLKTLAVSNLDLLHFLNGNNPSSIAVINAYRNECFISESGAEPKLIPKDDLKKLQNVITKDDFQINAENLLKYAEANLDGFEENKTLDALYIRKPDAVLPS